MHDDMTSLARIIGPQVAVLRRQPAGVSSSSSLPASSDQRAQLAAVRAAVLLGGFRRAEADDPEVYARVIEHTLARYDVEIQREVADAAKWKYPPTAYELRERCEALAGEGARAKQREERITAQLDKRRRLDALEAERPAMLTYNSANAPARLVRAELERIEAERFLARCKAEVEASATPAASSVFELDPDNWDA